MKNLFKSGRSSSRAKRKKLANRVSSWKMSNLFEFKTDTPVKGVFVLRSDKLTRAVEKNIKFLELAGVKDARELVKKWIYAFEQKCYYEGVLTACKAFKGINGYCQRYSVSHKSEELKFTQMTKLGIPVSVSFLTPLLRGNLSDRRNALHILQLFKLVVTKNSEVSYDSITDTSRINSSMVPNIIGAFFDKLSKLLPDYKIKIIRINTAYKTVLERLFPESGLAERINSLAGLSDIYISGKKGPNGPSLTHSTLDFIAISKTNILNSVKQLGRLTNNKVLLGIISDFEGKNGINMTEKINSKPLNTSRLSLVQESGGKNRVIAIGDWFSQSALKGMHIWLFRFLSKLDEDGTKDHNITALISKGWTNMKDIVLRYLPHSVDLSKATDRLPSLLQREIVNKMFGKEISDLWYDIMTNRDFLNIEGDKCVRYAVGQPMGLLSSWAMLAVTHHIILQTICEYLRIQRRDSQSDLSNYLIIGDDVAMRGDKLYNLYMFIMVELLQVPVSELKGFTPDTLDLELNPILVTDPNYRDRNETVACEIAKRIFINGVEVTPISPVAVQQGLEMPSDFPSLLAELARRGYNQFDSSNAVFSLAELNFNPVSAISLSSFPMSCTPQLEGLTCSLENGLLTKSSPWLILGWSEEDKSNLIKLVIKSLRNRLNVGIRDVYETIIPYMDYDCVDTEIQLSGGRTISSQGLNTLLTNVYRKCSDLVTDWATDFSKEGTREFWVGEECNSKEFKKYLGRMHVIFDINIALEGNSQIIDEKRFSSRFLMEIVKDFLRAQHIISDTPFI